MNFRVVMKEDAYTLKVAGWTNCLVTRLHNPSDVINGELLVELAHFLPHGASEMAPSDLETIFYVQKGQMNITMGDNMTYALQAGDSIHLSIGTSYALKNAGSCPSELVIMKVSPLENSNTISNENSYKITRADEFYSYAPVANTHKDCLTCRLHNAKDVRMGRFEVGISFYLPYAGGVHMPGDQYEMIYYVTDGEFEVPNPAGGKSRLHAGDSIHFGARNFRIADVSGYETGTFITIRVLPKDDPLCGK